MLHKFKVIIWQSRHAVSDQSHHAYNYPGFGTSDEKKNEEENEEVF